MARVHPAFSAGGVRRRVGNEAVMTIVTEIADELGGTVDHLSRYSDLDQARTILDAPPGVLEALWSRVNELAKHRRIDPQLRSDLLRVAEQIDPDLVPRLKLELDI